MNVSVVANGITEKLQGMVERINLAPAWLNRVAYPLLIEVQKKRWESENVTEGEQWAPLNPKYKTYKSKKFASYPGGGRKTLVATGRLYKSMVGLGSEHYKMVTENRIIMGTNVPYAKYVNQTRDITTLSKKTVDDLSRQYIEYVSGKR